MAKFEPPDQQPGESNHAYAARKSSALGRHNIAQAKEDKRKLTGDARTAAQKAADATGRGSTGRPFGTRHKSHKSGTRAQLNAAPDPTLERTTKRYQMGPCSRCHGSGRQKTGLINQRFVPCRKCGGGGQTWEKR